MPLTDTAIRNAKPAARAIRPFDGGGLYLEVAPAGGKWWRFKYRFGGKEKRASLGVYPDVPLSDKTPSSSRKVTPFGTPNRNRLAGSRGNRRPQRPGIKCHRRRGSPPPRQCISVQLSGAHSGGGEVQVAR